MSDTGVDRGGHAAVPVGSCSPVLIPGSRPRTQYPVHFYRQQEQYQAFVSVSILRTVTDIHEFNLTVYLLTATLVKGCNKPTEKLSSALPHALSYTLRVLH